MFNQLILIMIITQESIWCAFQSGWDGRQLRVAVPVLPPKAIMEIQFFFVRLHQIYIKKTSSELFLVFLTNIFSPCKVLERFKTKKGPILFWFHKYAVMIWQKNTVCLLWIHIFICQGANTSSIYFQLNTVFPRIVSAVE